MKFLKGLFKKTPTANPNIDYVGIAEELLGTPGAIVVYVSSAEVYTNACVFNEAKEKIWYGDLNIANSDRALNELATCVGMIYVAPEHPARWEGLDQALEDSKRGHNRKVLTYGD